MPKLIPSKKFVKDIKKFQSDTKLRKKIAKVLSFLEDNPLHPGLNLERIVNDPAAWSVRVDHKYRLSFEPEEFLPSGTPDWSASVFLLRLLDHDDLYLNVARNFVSNLQSYARQGFVVSYLRKNRYLLYFLSQTL